MKILLVNSLYPPNIIGGAEVSVSLLAQAMVQRGHHVTVVSLHNEARETVETVDGVRVHRLPLDNLYWPFGLSQKPLAAERLRWHLKDMWNEAAGARFGKILDEQKPEIVNSHNLTGFSVSVWGEARRRGIPLVHTLRDYSLICKRSTLFANGQTCERRCVNCTLMTLTYKRKTALVDRVVSISRYLLQAHQSRGYFSGTPSALIRNIANLNGVGERPPEDDVVFGYIGRIEDEKGIEVVLKATLSLPSTGWRLRIAGRGLDSYVAALRREYPNPRIEWLGFAKSSEFYASIDVCLVSSVWPEPLSRAMIESIAAGRSTIASTAGGIPEIAGYSALIGTYEPRDDARLAELMKAALAAPEQWRMPHPPSDEVKRHFSAETIAKEYLSLYKDTVRAPSQRHLNEIHA